LAICAVLALVSCDRNMDTSPSRTVARTGKSDFQEAEKANRNDEQARKAIDALVLLMNDEDPKVRRQAAFSLGLAGAEDDDAVQALIEALKDDDEDVRRATIEAISKIGPAAKTAIPALLDTIACGNTPVVNVVIAIGSIGEDGIPSLVARHDDPDPRVRQVVAEALGQIYFIKGKREKESEAR